MPEPLPPLPAEPLPIEPAKPAWRIVERHEKRSRLKQKATPASAPPPAIADTPPPQPQLAAWAQWKRGCSSNARTTILLINFLLEKLIPFCLLSLELLLRLLPFPRHQSLQKVSSVRNIAQLHKRQSEKSIRSEDSPT